MKKVELSVDELNMLQAYRDAQAKLKATANASGNNGSNHDLGTSVADKPRRKYMMQLVYRVIKKARQLFAKQLKKDTQAKIECLEAALASCQDLYPDPLRFELDFRAERERLTDSKRFCDACEALKLVPEEVADHVVFEGKGTLEKVLKEGLQVLGENVHMFNKPIWSDSESLYADAHQAEEGADE